MKYQKLPALVIFKVLLPQSNVMAAVFIARADSSLVSLQVCKHTEITMSHNLQFYSLWSFPAEL